MLAYKQETLRWHWQQSFTGSLIKIMTVLLNILLY